MSGPRIFQLVVLPPLVLFALLFAATFSRPAVIEKAANGYLKTQVKNWAGERWDLKLEPVHRELVQKFKERLTKQAAFTRKLIEKRVADRIAKTIATLCQYDCDKRKHLADTLREVFKSHLKTLTKALDGFKAGALAQYRKLLRNLVVDVRIFSGSNLSVFTLLILVSLLKPTAFRVLWLPGGLLYVATIGATCFYIFGQDWFFTVLTDDFVGFGYLSYIGVLYGFLLDIVFNKARVTNGLIHLIGAVISTIGKCIPG